MTAEPVPPIGVQLLEGLTKALAQNSSVQVQLAVEIKALREELKGLREDLGTLSDDTDELSARIGVVIEVVDQVAQVGVERAPRWDDVAEVLEKLREAAATEDDGGQEIFPPGKK